MTLVLFVACLLARQGELKPWPGPAPAAPGEAAPPEKAPAPPPGKNDGGAKRKPPPDKKPDKAAEDPCGCDRFLRDALQSCESSGDCSPDYRTRIYVAHGQCRAGCREGGAADRRRSGGDHAC